MIVSGDLCPNSVNVTRPSVPIRIIGVDGGLRT